ncbi:hypothetical protein RND71_040416 [Anisodus tanguticus]|uniref:Uncharacterized protein n=1 Tax=Anisodus tanguticus TaxID=243964 RepID=A0AAE1QS50_9SOLA|nr:hypothetical protein RND71_040416 [Anisodus tanguticus]
MVEFRKWRNCNVSLSSRKNVRHALSSSGEGKGVALSSSSSSNRIRSVFGIFPSWGLSQKLSRVIGPNRAREVSLTATLEMGSELLNKARQIAEAIIKNNQDLVLRYKAVINDGFKLDLTRALALEKSHYLQFKVLAEHGLFAMYLSEDLKNHILRSVPPHCPLHRHDLHDPFVKTLEYLVQTMEFLR